MILLLEFNTSQMIKKVGRRDKKRPISSKTARAMSTWSHYKFKQRLLFKSQEFPWCQVIIVTEEYTSKTCTRCGHDHKRLGDSKVFKCPTCGLEIDRDINGARNILLKYLTERRLSMPALGLEPAIRSSDCT